MCPPTGANECGVPRTLWPTTPISSLISPQSNYAAWEDVAAEPTVATSEFAAPRSQHQLRPSHYGRCLAKRPPAKPSPCSTHSFLGCAARKGDIFLEPASTPVPATSRR